MSDDTMAPPEPGAGPDPDADADVAVARRGGRIAPVVATLVAVVMIGLLVVLVGAEPGESNEGTSPLIGRPAPEAVGELDDGRPFDLSRRRGSWVVLNFFASNCVPCIREHPELIEFVDQQRELGSEGAEFYSVVFGDTRSRVEAFFEERGGDWPVIYSDGDVLPVAFGVNLVPETWIVDPQGIVCARFISEVTAASLNVTLQQLRERGGAGCVEIVGA
ncbi:MAG: TlpA disulfide reductase family protein [Actinomycetota bacterium]